MDTSTRPRRTTVAEGISDLLFRTRGFFPIFAITTAVGSILAWMGQGQDLIRTVTDIGSEHTGFDAKVFWLCLSVVVLAFQAWFWARVIVETEFGPREEWRYRYYLTWAPRLLGLIPFVLLFIALWRVNSANAWLAWLLAGLGLAFFILSWARLPLTKAMHRASERLQKNGRPKAAAALEISLTNLRRTVLGVGIAYAIIAMAVIIVDPVRLPVFFGPAAVVLTACALFIPILTTLLLIGGRYHLRIGITLLLLVIVFSYWVDNHEVRRSRSSAAVQRAAILGRPTLDQAYKTWRAQFPIKTEKPIPLIFVASEGGASRAGYWTAAVLSQLEMESKGEFSKHVFAISSISGGSLGVAGFLSSIQDQKTGAAIAAGGVTLRQAVSSFVGDDYLSPALAGMLFPDLLQRFVPISVLPDRSEALEKGWEYGWRKRCEAIPCDDPSKFSTDFLSLWSQPSRKAWIPAWLIGGALQEDGRPVLTSNIQVGNAIDAWDFHYIAGTDVRLSTAILNGARFPYVSSSGTISNPVMPHHVDAVHIVDGGYFDAAGVEVARGLAQSMVASGGVASTDNIQPIFLLISNDGVNPPFTPDAVGAVAGPSTPIACRDQSPKSGCPGKDGGLSTIAPDLFGPIQGLYRSRAAHGERLKTLLYRFAPTQAGGVPTKVLTVDLCSMAVPMNWALSANARHVVDDLLTEKQDSAGECERQNISDFNQLISILRS